MSSVTSPKLASGIVMQWVEEATEHGCCPNEKLDEAIKVAIAMRCYRNRKYPD